ncbi:ankyrin repeat-containing domain protein [Aspergillus granulosus]|uniref:Ankyrin repeat-containing domain protein n=1 Tax=Aspergillus granulosus TaxID=176169 RepID=A0ABR4GS87_9EURO
MDSKPNTTNLPRLIATSAAEGNIKTIKKVLIDAPRTRRRSLKVLALQHATQQNQGETVKSLLGLGANPFSTTAQADLYGELTSVLPGQPTALHLAVENGYTSIVEVLLRSRRYGLFPLRSRGSKREGTAGMYWMTALHAACIKGDANMVELLLAHGAKVRYLYGCERCHADDRHWRHHNCVTCDPRGSIAERRVLSRPFRFRSALDFAVEMGHEALVRRLLQAGAAQWTGKEEMRFRGVYRKLNPVASAAGKGYVEVVKLLLENGYDATAPGSFGTPLQEGLQARHVEVVQVLLENGGRYIENTTPARWDEGILWSPTKARDTEMVRTILTYGESEITLQALHKAIKLAAGRHDAAIFRACLEFAQRVYGSRSLDYTEALQRVISRRSVDNVQFLLDHWDIQGDQKTRVMQTAMLTTGKAGSYKIAQVLLSWDPSQKNRPSYLTACYFGACISNDLRLIKLLLADGLSLHSSLPGSTPYPESPTEKLSLRNYNMTMPLHTASQYGSTLVCKFLLHHGVDANGIGDKGEAPLHHAAEGGSAETTQLLINHGAKVRARDNDEKTALYAAAARGKTAVIELLLKKCPKLVQESEAGEFNRPICVAAQRQHHDAFRLLQAHGARVTGYDRMCLHSK